VRLKGAGWTGQRWEARFSLARSVQLEAGGESFERGDAAISKR
jgi:hypothetical protein